MRRLYNLVGNCRISDKSKGLYDKDNHITTKYLLALKNYNGDKCYHCQCILDWDNLQHIRRYKQVTLQRIDNKKGHWIGEKDKLYSYDEIRAKIMEQDASRVAGLK
jgi:ligand-binding sensor domain-containing protein